MQDSVCKPGTKKGENQNSKFKKKASDFSEAFSISDSIKA